MSATITHAVEALLGSRDHRSATRGIDLSAALLLLILLVEAEIIRAYLGTRRPLRLQPLGVAIVPLCLVFVFVVIVRAKALR
jgi:hypothetical protein